MGNAPLSSFQYFKYATNQALHLFHPEYIKVPAYTSTKLKQNLMPAMIVTLRSTHSDFPSTLRGNLL
jgi:hypothetical protein